MPCPHYRIKISSRANSPPTTAQAAYQSGERLYDERTHRTKSYTEKRGIVFTEIVLPGNAPKEYADRNTLWNAVERAEANWNAQTARRLEIALPKELPLKTGIEMIREYVRDQFVSQGMIADIAVHDPDPPNHNPHAHVMLTMRALDEQGRWLPKSRREYILDENGERIKGEDGKWKFRKVFTTDWDNRDNAEKWRQAWEDVQNRYLEAAGCPERIILKSYERQEIDLVPTVHMGPAVTAMERRGIETNIGNLNREIKKTNALIAALKRAISRIREWITGVKEAIAEIEMQPKEVLLVDLLIQRYNERENRLWKATDSDRGQLAKEREQFTTITAYMKERGISSVADLDSRIETISATTKPIKEQVRFVTKQIYLIRNVLEYGARRDKLSSVHNQFEKIRWKGRKEKFAKEHKEELEAWNRADRYIRKCLPEQQYSESALQDRLSSLTAQLNELNAHLAPYQEETQILREADPGTGAGARETDTGTQGVEEHDNEGAARRCES